LKLRKAIFNWREPKSSFNFKLGSFVAEHSLFIENIQPLLDLITLPLFVILAKNVCPCLNIQDFSEEFSLQHSGQIEGKRQKYYILTFYNSKSPRLKAGRLVG
jgi:hypothetical protein